MTGSENCYPNEQNMHPAHARNGQKHRQHSARRHGRAYRRSQRTAISAMNPPAALRRRSKSAPWRSLQILACSPPPQHRTGGSKT
jgi:hypothetical protein